MGSALVVLDAGKPLEAVHGALFWLRRGEGLGVLRGLALSSLMYSFEYAELSCE
jgi:hypothetical protein